MSLNAVFMCNLTITDKGLRGLCGLVYMNCCCEYLDNETAVHSDISLQSGMRQDIMYITITARSGEL